MGNENKHTRTGWRDEDKRKKSISYNWDQQQKQIYGLRIVKCSVDFGMDMFHDAESLFLKKPSLTLTL